MEENNLPEGVIEASQLPEGEQVYLKKDSLGWRVVHPERKWYKMYKEDWYWVIGTTILTVVFYLGIQEVIAANIFNACGIVT